MANIIRDWKRRGIPSTSSLSFAKTHIDAVCAENLNEGLRVLNVSLQSRLGLPRKQCGQLQIPVVLVGNAELGDGEANDLGKSA